LSKFLDLETGHIKVFLELLGHIGRGMEKIIRQLFYRGIEAIEMIF
jgi:hypothetical protein